MKQYIIFILFFLGILGISCKKYLDKKPDQKLAIPVSLNDFQKLLDNSITTDNCIPQVGDLSSDNYYVKDQTYTAFTTVPKNCYKWASDIWEGTSPSDWNSPYLVIYYANVVLEGLSNIQSNSSFEETRKNEIYGQALFLRALAHYSLEEIFGQPYIPASASSDLGIPLKLTANLANVAVRASVDQVYSQIIKDLENAINLLPQTNSPVNRPSRTTAYALLAKVYLTKQDYTNAGLYADSAMQIKGSLKNFNDADIDKSATSPFSVFARPNDFIEISYPASTVNYTIFNQTTTLVDSNLYNSYGSNDLRKTIFFRNVGTNLYAFKGGYLGSTLRTFGGLSVNEMYLIKSEAYARMNNINSAMDVLNALLINRWKSGTFVPFTAANADDALRIILRERRKELVIRATRWTDLRRLNQDQRFAVTITRNISGQTYTLLPNDNKYTFPIPNIEINVSGIQQNPR